MILGVIVVTETAQKTVVGLGFDEHSGYQFDKFIRHILQ
jgi:hypothetical protein